MKLYRIVVDHWPTDDGEPWERFIGNPYSAGYARVNFDDDGQKWFASLVDPDTSEVCDSLEAAFGAGHDDSGEVIGWILPRTDRRHYLSRAAAYRWVERAHLLGALAHVDESEHITWKGAVA